MEPIKPDLFFYQWQRKLIALVTAIVIWVVVNHTITATKVIPFVPIRMINLPTDKVIPGLLPNGFFTKRATLTVTGTKDVIEQLEPGDIEILLDVSNFHNDSIVQINKKNLVSLNPNINLSKHITAVSNLEFSIKMSPILKEKIPIHINIIGSAPKGFDFLDFWPVSLTQTIVGAEEQILPLKNQGLELTLNLDDISEEKLNELFLKRPHENEVVFFVPDEWKKIHIPFLGTGFFPINDIKSDQLKVNFLRGGILPFTDAIPIHVFYPLQNSQVINPETYPLIPTQYIQLQNQIPTFKFPLFAKNINQLFLEIVKNSVELQIVTAPLNEREKLEWAVGFIDEEHLEDTYAAFLLNQSEINHNASSAQNKEKEYYFRKRFRLYKKRFALYLSPEYQLEIESYLKNNRVRIHIPNAALVTKKEVSNAK